LRSILHLALKKSRIRGAGLGLFTLIPRNKGEFVAEYTGKFVSRKEFTNSQYISQYGVDYTKDLVLDAKNTQTAVGRYSNDCRSVNVLKRECRGTNARFVKDYKNKKINIKAVKRIPAGGEIFLDYGEHYWG
jgi:SET domain-containing protein